MVSSKNYLRIETSHSLEVLYLVLVINIFLSNNKENFHSKIQISIIPYFPANISASTLKMSINLLYFWFLEYRPEIF